MGGGGVKAAVLQKLRVDVDACDFADHHQIAAFEIKHLQRAAFEAGGGLSHARARDGFAFGLLHACHGKFIHPQRQRGRACVHLRQQVVADEVDGKDAAALHVADAVFVAACEHHLHRGVGNGVEKRIGREVVAHGATGRDPADGAGGDDGLEGVVLEALAVFGAVEHRRLPSGLILT